MFFMPKNRSIALYFMIAVAASSIMAYNGSDAFLHYYAAPSNMLTQYQSVCKSLVLSNETSDTLKHAKDEFDLAIPKLLGGSTLPMADGAGAIVLAEQGSAPVASAGIDYSTVTSEGFIIKTISGKTYITSKSQVGVLRGAFRFLRLMQTQKDINNLNIVENPYFAYRVLDHWYNHYGSSYEADRLYAGHRVFKMENFGNLSSAELKLIVQYCRMAAALGLNGVTPDCVNTYQKGSNANYKCLEVANLKNEKVFADLIGTYGLKYYMSVSYASPRLVSPTISSADAAKVAAAKQWWFDKVDTVRVYIKNFGGFLLKADSEGEQGPRSTYSETQSQGANPIAQSLGRYGLILVWRTFIYGTQSADNAVNSALEFASPAQTWDSAVVLRHKEGPYDFQPVEPPHHLLQMPGIRHGMEVQITHEYTGQAIHVDWLAPKWQQVLQFNNVGASLWDGATGTTSAQLIKGNGATTGGMWGISNLSDTVNWTGHFLLQADYYGYGRLTWDPNIPIDTIADEWTRCSIDNGNNPGINYVVKHILERSWRAYCEYAYGHGIMQPQLADDAHYVVDYNALKNSSYFNAYEENFLSDGIGVDRTSTGDNFVKYLSTTLADSFSNKAKCPDDYILFYHHMHWADAMKSGMTLIQQLEFEHFRGIHRVQRFIRYWNLLKATTNLDAEIYGNVSSKLSQQLIDGSTWANTFRTEFGACYSSQVPCRLDIITSDTTKAATVESGANLTLTGLMRTQGASPGWAGTTVADTFVWNVTGPGAANLSSSKGLSTVFSASTPGVYTVTCADAKWPSMTEDEQIFVGDWSNNSGTPVERAITKLTPKSLKILQGAQRFVITSPFAGKVSIITPQGRVIKSISAEKEMPVVWNIRGVAGGLYLLKVQSEKQTLQSKVFIQ
jgi:alpha-glucuronidase